MAGNTPCNRSLKLGMNSTGYDNTAKDTKDSQEDEPKSPSAGALSNRPTDEHTHTIHYPLNGLDLSLSRYYHALLGPKDLVANILIEAILSPTPQLSTILLTKLPEPFKLTDMVALQSSFAFDLALLSELLWTEGHREHHAFYYSGDLRWNLSLFGTYNNKALNLAPVPLEEWLLDILQRWNWEGENFDNRTSISHLRKERNKYVGLDKMGRDWPDHKSKTDRQQGDLSSRLEHFRPNLRTQQALSIFSGPSRASSKTVAQRISSEVCTECRHHSGSACHYMYQMPLKSQPQTQRPLAPSLETEEEELAAASGIFFPTVVEASPWHCRCYDRLSSKTSWIKSTADFLPPLYRPHHLSPKRTQSCPPFLTSFATARIPVAKNIFPFLGSCPPKCHNVFFPTPKLSQIIRRARRRSLSRSNIKDMFTAGRHTNPQDIDVASTASLVCGEYFPPETDGDIRLPRTVNRSLHPAHDASLTETEFPPCANCGRGDHHGYGDCMAPCGICGDEEHKAQKCPVPKDARCKCAAFPTFHSARRCPVVCSRECGDERPVGSAGHLNAMGCRSRCCMCGIKRGHCGKECKLLRCRCGGRHLGQDCGWKVECRRVGCWNYRCGAHCWGCGRGKGERRIGGKDEKARGEQRQTLDVKGKKKEGHRGGGDEFVGFMCKECRAEGKVGAEEVVTGRRKPRPGRRWKKGEERPERWRRNPAEFNNPSDRWWAKVRGDIADEERRQKGEDEERGRGRSRSKSPPVEDGYKSVFG